MPLNLTAWCFASTCDVNAFEGILLGFCFKVNGSNPQAHYGIQDALCEVSLWL